MSKPAPIVAELGRPETPEETAARKAASSKAYRSSQTMRSLVAALLVTLAVVLVIVFAVPRGEPTTAKVIDVAGIAADVESTMDSPVIVPEADEFWPVNIGGVEWDVFKPGSANSNQNVSYAIGTQAGDDYVLLYGSRSAASTADLAETLIPQIRALSEAS
jgi:hypothetical protein